jgi:hypothetical protein
MRNLTRLTVASLVFAFCCLTSTVVRADPFVITSGYISNSGSSIVVSEGAYNFAGAGIQVIGGGTEMGHLNVYNCAPCSPAFAAAHHVNASGFFVRGGGFVTINGTTYPPVHFTGTLNVTGPELVFPNSLPAFTIYTVTVPFEMTGTLGGDTVAPVPGGPPNIVFDVTLTGRGLATFQFFVGDSGITTTYTLMNARYNFQPAPVPEPATLLLMGAGLAGVAAKIRKRRRISK